jgi:hypothetical protein
MDIRDSLRPSTILGVGLTGCGSDTGGSPGAKPDGAADAGADVPVDSSAGVADEVGIMPPRSSTRMGPTVARPSRSGVPSG